MAVRGIGIIPKGHDLANLVELKGASVFPNLQNSIRSAANMVLKEWVSRIDSSNAKEGWKRKYREAVQVESMSGLSATVSAEGLYPWLVENGREAWSIKEALLNGPRAQIVKRGKNKGKRYNRVFIEKFTPKAKGSNKMTAAQYEVAKTMGRGETFKKRVISMAAGIKGSAPNTKFESRIKKMAKERMSPDLARMMRVGEERQHQYGTFYNVSEDSQGWEYPDIQAVPIFDDLFNDMTDKITDKLADGLMKDLVAGMDRLK